MVASVKVFKKTSPNGKVTVYLGKRDFVDHLDRVDPIDGVVVADNDYLKNRKVFGQIIVTIRYGRQSDEVMGLQFVKELCLISETIYPEKSNKKPMSPLQEKLVKKLGSAAHAFTFQLPTSAPTSITMHEGDDGSVKTAEPVGVDFELRAFVGENQEDKSHNRSTVSMAIRKVQYAPVTVSTKQPSTMVSKGFTFSPGKLNLQVTLDRELFYHGEAIRFNVQVKNESKKTVKGLQVAIVQITEITLINGHNSKKVTYMDTREGCPITPGSSLTKVFSLTPSVNGAKDVRGVALDGFLKDEDVNLASSTLSSDGSNTTGFIVSYVARVKLNMGSMGGDLVGDVPFKLMHPAPGSAAHPGKGGMASRSAGGGSTSYARDDDDEIVFEDFARLRSS